MELVTVLVEEEEGEDDDESLRGTVTIAETVVVEEVVVVDGVEAVTETSSGAPDVAVAVVGEEVSSFDFSF